MGHRIAFVDDMPSILESVHWIFRDEPFDIFLFHNPMEVLQKMEEVEFAVVVADQNMPEMEGTALLQQVRERWPGTVRIIMTSYTDPNIAINAINQGNVYRFISKPWNNNEMVVMVKNAVALYELRSENKRLYQITTEQNEQLQQLNQNLETELEARIREIKENEEQRRNLEVQLVRAQKTEAIGNLAGGIAHDFNNILTAIMGYTEVVYFDIAEGTPAKGNLKKVLDAGIRAKDLVKQITSSSRQTVAEKSPVQISPIVEEVTIQLKASLPCNIDIRRNIENETGLVEVDPTKIHQVVMNLCTNAIHAMREKGGRLEVSLMPVELETGERAINPNIEPGSYLKFSISDTGCGIEPHIKNRIFEPYFTTKEKEEGTGLGLAVVHGIIQSYNGTISVESEPGVGTTFHVFLPRVNYK